MTDGQRSLRELEKRLEKEPDNLSLRVTVAGLLSEAGRATAAVELYRSVALAYRDQGRTQQAIAVCRSIVELAPNDTAIEMLLVELATSGNAARGDDPLVIEPSTATGAAATAERRPRTPSGADSTHTGSRTPPGVSEPFIDKPAALPRRPGTGSPPPSGHRPPTQPPTLQSAQRAASLSRPVVPAPAGAKTPTRPPPLRTPPAGLPARRSTRELDTPLPTAVPYHVADPTSSPTKVSNDELSARPSTERFEAVRGAEGGAFETVSGAEGGAFETVSGAEGGAFENALPTRPGEGDDRPEVTGLAQAARRISGLIAQDQLPPARPSGDHDLMAELDTRQVPRLSAAELEKVSQPPPTVPTEKIDRDHDHDLTTPIPTPGPRAERASALWTPTSPAMPIRDTPVESELRGTRDSDEDVTAPRELAGTPLGNAFFLPLPPNRREVALAKCLRKTARAGSPVIRQGETSHPLILVVTGTLELRVERANGTNAIVDTIESGQYIGEGALLGRLPASATAIAIVDSELLALPPHALFELAGAYPALWAALKDTAERRTRQYERILRASP